MKKILSTTALSILLLSSSTSAAEVTKEQLAALQAQIKQLQEQINLLQRKQEVAEEIKKNDDEKFAKVEYGNKGLKISSADKKYELKIGGYAQADTRKYFGNEGNNADQFLLRSARPTFEFKLPGDFSGKVTTDFGNNQTRLVDAYTDWKANDYLNFRLGKFKAPLGLERWQGETETLFVERGLTTNLVPFRDIGVGAFGEIIPQTLEYQFALTNGVADLGDGNGDSSGGKDFSARIFAQPFKNTDYNWLQGFGVGVAGSIGQRDGTTTNTELSSGLKTTAQNNFFTYNPAAGTVFANGKSTRINPQAWYYNGPFELLGEYVKEDYEVSKSTAPSTRTSLTNDAWTVITTYVLTGEDASFAGVKPKADFNLDKGTWGAFELAARVGKLNIDDKTFPTFAAISSSAKSIDEKIVGLNWYLNQNLKFNFNFVINKFEGGSATGDRPDEKVALARVQFKF